MKTTSHKINTKDGIVLRGLINEPENSTKKIVAHVHGTASNFYEGFFLQPIALTLAEKDVAFSPFNNTGNGLVTTLVKETQNKPESIAGGTYIERFENCVTDIKAHVDFLESQGYEEIHLSGHSLGASKIAYYLTQTKDPRIKSVLLLSPPDILGLVKIANFDFDTWINLATKMSKENEGDKIMPEWINGMYPITANTFVNFFADESNATIFNFLNSNDRFDVLSKISVPVFVAMGTMDDFLTISIDETMNIIKRHTKSSPKCETYIIDGASHSYHDHGKELAEKVTNWIVEN